MYFKNKTLRTGITMSIALLLTSSLIVSCSKDAQVAPQTSDLPATASNSTSVANTTNSLATTYTTSSPISYSGKSNLTISGLSFDGAANLISLTNCSNIHITQCRFSNATAYAVKLYNCTNVTVDACYFTNVAFGVYGQQSKVIKINSNQCLNLKGGGSIFAHFAQLDNVNGGGNQINNNRIENIAGVAVQPHDIISLYESNGLQGDSIQVIGNWIRGGQLALNAAKNNGACGIGLMDGSGSYQVCRGNILVNPGFAGIQPVGNGTGLKIDHNTIFSSQTPVSLVGLSYQLNGSGYAGYNTINWTASTGTKVSEWSSVTQPGGWGTNIVNANISASVLPATIITMQ
jgi:hypothetical protein